MPFSFTPSVDLSNSPSFGRTNNSKFFHTVLFESQGMSGQNSRPITFGGTGTTVQGIPSSPIMWGGSSSGSMSSSTIASGQSTKPNDSAPTNGVTPMDACGAINPLWPSNGFSVPNNGGKTVSPFSSGTKATSSSTNIWGSSTVETDKSRTDASGGKESKHQQKLQSDEMEKSVKLILKDVISHQEDMKSWIERYRSLELEKIEATRIIKQLREELAQVTRSKDAIIAEYLESPAFTKRLDEEHEKRLSEIFHPSYVKALRTVQTKSPGSTVQTKSPGSTMQTESPGTMQTESPGTMQTRLPGTAGTVQTESPGTVQTKLPGAVQTKLPGTVQTKLPEIDTWEMVSPLHRMDIPLDLNDSSFFDKWRSNAYKKQQEKEKTSI